MNRPKIMVLAHGGSQSIEAARARGLAQAQPPDRVAFLWREKDRWRTAWEWRRKIILFCPDLLYVINTSMPGAWLAVWFRRARGLPFILDTGDLIYEMATRAGTAPAWKRACMKWTEQMAQRWAEIIVVRGTRHQQHLRQSGYQRTALIRDGFNPVDEIAPARISNLRRELKLEGIFVVGVLGSLVYSPRLGICYGWDLIQALALLRDLPICGVVVGDGDGRRWLENQAREYHLQDKIRFCGRIPYSEVPLYLRLFDVALSTQTNNLPGQVRTTGKLAEYMANQCFILASRVGEAELLLPESMLVDYSGEVDLEYPRRLAERLRLLFREPGRLQVGKELRRVAEENCSYAVLSRRFNEVTESATGSGRFPAPPGRPN